MPNRQLNSLKTLNKTAKSRNNSSSQVELKQEPTVVEESTPEQINKNSVLNLLEAEENMGYDIELDEEDDPYDVVHCSCGNHKSDGFMIQCIFLLNLLVMGNVNFN
jgi:hypothetical protein